MVVKKHKDGWGVWRDEASSRYALPVTWSMSKHLAIAGYIRYMQPEIIVPMI